MNKASQVEIQFGGKTYRGTYTVSDGHISVETDYGSKVALVGMLVPETLAEIMLREMAQAGRASPAE